MTPSVNWGEIIDKALRDSSKAWEEEFLAANKTAAERHAALEKLKREADLEWANLIAVAGDKAIKYNVTAAEIAADKRYWETSLEPIGNTSTYRLDSDRYIIDKNGNILWNTKYFGKDKSKYRMDNYISDEYLTGDDFFTTSWSNTPSGVLLKQLKSNWLTDIFRPGSRNTIKQVKNDWSKWLNSVASAEKERWKNDFLRKTEETKRRGAAALANISGIPKAGQAIQTATDSIRKDISDALGQLREAYTSMPTEFANDVIDKLQELGTKAINGYKAKAYDWSVQGGRAAVGYLRERFGNVAGRLNGVVPEPIARVLAPASKILGGTLGKVADRLGLRGWLGAVKSGGNSLADTDVGIPAFKHTLNITQPIDHSDYLTKLLDSTQQDEWEKDQLVHLGLNLRRTMQIMLEDFGYVNSILRSINYTRNFHFINRPVMESETNSYYRTYAFLTRPNLNLFIDNKLNPALDNYPELKSIVLTDPGLYAELCRDGAYKSNLFKFLNNYIKEVNFPRLAETNREGIMNMHGKSMPAPGVPEIYGENEVTIIFMDNNRGDVTKLLYMMGIYKEYTAKQGFPMRPMYIKNKGLDYLMTLYTVSVDMNWNMINFAVCYSLIPPEPPTHLANMKLDGMSKNEYMEDVSMSFKCTTVIPFAPDMIDTFNLLSGFNMHNLVDTRGASGTTLIATGRTNQTILSEGKSERKPLFRANFKERQGDNPGDEPVFPYKGIFEMMAISPGFYRLSNVSDKDKLRDTRLNIKFGFSS